MKKKILKAILLISVLAALTFTTVLAGFVMDVGELPGTPPGFGEANWTAWTTLINITDGRPIEILTEDNTNSELGENLGYSEYGDGDTNTEWWIQVENFSNPVSVAGYPIKMIFGGIGARDGELWTYEFVWNNIEPFTYHPVPGSSILPGAEYSCPITTPPVIEEGDNTIRFYGQPGLYHVYRSQNASGAENGASNGQYFYLTSATTDIHGAGSFVDNTSIPSWYVVIQADTTTNALIGCHSELYVGPTAVTMGQMNVQLDESLTSTKVSWDTLSELSAIGFNVYRSESVSGPRQKLTSNLILAIYHNMVGGDYEFIDNNVLAGHTYYYWVEEWLSGEEIGPEDIFVGKVIYLPLIFSGD